MGIVRFSFVDGSVELVRVGSTRYHELTAAGHVPDGSVPPADGISDALELYLAGVLGSVVNPTADTILGLGDAVRATLVDTLTEGDGVTLVYNGTTKTLTVTAEGGGLTEVAIGDVTGLQDALDDLDRDASQVAFDPSTVDLEATTVQAAVVELAETSVDSADLATLSGRVDTLETNAPPEAKRWRLTAGVTLAASSTGLQDVAGATFTSLPANSEYDFQVELAVDGPDAGDVKVGFTGPAGGDIQFVVTGPNAGNAADGGTQKSVVRTGFGQPSGGFGTLAAAAQPLIITGTILAGPTGGTVQLQAAQNTSDATAPTIRALSKGTAVRVV